MKLSARAPSLFLHVCSLERDARKVYWELNQPRFWGTHVHRKWAFFCFNTVCLDTTKFVLLRVFTLKETICPRICRNSRPNNFPFTCVAQKKKNKLPIVARNGDPWMSSLKYTFRWPRISLFIYLFNPRYPNIKIQFLICCPYRFPMKVVGTSCWIRFIFCDHVLNSRDHFVPKEKLDADHFQGF